MTYGGIEVARFGFVRRRRYGLMVYGKYGRTGLPIAASVGDLGSRFAHPEKVIQAKKFPHPWFKLNLIWAITCWVMRAYSTYCYMHGIGHMALWNGLKP